MNDDIEDKLFNDFEKAEFFKRVDELGIDIEKVCVKKKEYNEHYHKFNIFVDSLKEDEAKSLITLAGFLLEDYFIREVDVLACFDENNTWAIREEAELKRKKGNVKSVLDHFLFL